MTHEQVKARLIAGEKLEDMFPIVSGQECDIIKAEEFSATDDIIYFPDLYMNDLDGRAWNEDEAERIASDGYSGIDFLFLCDGKEDLARELFNYCDWQNPASALPEVKGNELIDYI